MWNLFTTMPEQAAEWAAQVDWINDAITNISVLCTVLVTGAMLYFAWKYRRRSDDQETAFIPDNIALETVWTVVPTVVVIWTFVYGFIVYRDMRTPPANPIEINVDAYKWRWEYTYGNGKKASKDLVVPLGKPVRLIMTSHDVIHSFFIPAMRVKEDVYGGNYSYLWFTPTKLGKFHIFCAEYCGTSHSTMTGTLEVVSPEAFEDFLLDRKDPGAPALPPAELGKMVFEQKGCNSCHSVDGSALVGPSLKGIFAMKERPLQDGSKVDVDENYIRESIRNPNAKIAAGFAPSMQQYPEDQLSAQQLQEIIAYLKTL